MWKKVRDRETRSPARETHALPFTAQAQNQLSAIGYPLPAISFHIVMDEVGEWDEAAGLA